MASGGLMRITECDPKQEKGKKTCVSLVPVGGPHGGRSTWGGEAFGDEKGKQHDSRRPPNVNENK